MLILGQKFKRPAFADLGESKLLELMTNHDRGVATKLISSLTGLICVSHRLIDEVVHLGADPDKILYAPNTVDKQRFFPLDKAECRKRLGLPKNDFIVAFTGYFWARKGPLRLLRAINTLNLPIKAIFLGSGEQRPKGERVLFADVVPNKELPVWLNAADIFALPTLAEGNCNAINEAMACGLPIVSSNINDIRTQVPETAGILVNPNNCDELANAIKTLFENREMLKKLSQECLSISDTRNKIPRSNKIANWMKSIVYSSE